LSKLFKTLIVIPTLNEEKNIKKIAHKILLLKKNYLNILFVDDNSLDGSQEEIILLKKKYCKVV
jgi:glycosyltransferase involved in cell wall biosynthesis